MVENLPANARDARDAGSVLGLDRSPIEGNGSPFRYSCLENPIDRGAWHATVHGVTKSQTQLSDWTTMKTSWLWITEVKVIFNLSFYKHLLKTSYVPVPVLNAENPREKTWSWASNTRYGCEWKMITVHDAEFIQWGWLAPFSMFRKVFVA